ncbi:MAG: IS200/IS605 family transposase [Myxococcaceae bacterium]|nr:MAG: IS200/IS605 family transposase [Myxococcaceae bacterium]
MFHRHVELYLHFIWSTWDRHPWIEESMQPRLHAVLASIARSQGCSFAVAGGIGEHVHVLVRAPATSCPADLVRHLKGVSSRFAHTELCVDPSFNWSQGYALFSVDPESVSALTAYIDDQPRHHSAGTMNPRWEQPARVPGPPHQRPQQDCP